MGISTGNDINSPEENADYDWISSFWGSKTGKWKSLAQGPGIAKSLLFAWSGPTKHVTRLGL